MQTDLWKLYINSRIFEFLTACSKIKLLRMRKNVIVLKHKGNKNKLKVTKILFCMYLLTLTTFVPSDADTK